MRRKLLILFFILVSGRASYAQVAGEHAHHFFLDFDAGVGAVQQDYKSIPLTSNYLNVVNAKEGQMKFTGGYSQSYNMQLGYFFNKKRNIALSVGFLYVVQSGKLGVDSFHVEYQSLDYRANIFRQLITADNGIHESITTSNLSIPILAKYRFDISNRWFCTLDGGIMFNIQSWNNYKANATFDYEAIYKMDGTGTNLTFLYDNGAVPGGEDWLITKNEFMKDNPNGNIQSYFNSLRSIGYNVGLQNGVTRKTGGISYFGTSLGYLVQPAINFRASENLVVRLGAYYISQSFRNTEKKTHLLVTDQLGSYTSLLNYATTVESVNTGITLGLSIYFNSYMDKRYDHVYY